MFAPAFPLPTPFPDPTEVDWPLFGLTADVRPALAAAIKAGEPAVLVTLHSARGGAPFGVGAQMVFSRTGMAGYLSGGCIEADVALHAEQVLANGVPRRLVYGEGGPVDLRLLCGSRIELLVERIEPEDDAARALLDLTARRRPALWVTDGTRRICVEAGESQASEPLGSFGPNLVRRPYAPTTRLIVIGGDPVAIALARLGLETECEVTLIRPNGPERPPCEVSRYLRSDMSEAFATVVADKWTAVAVVTHDPDQQHAALVAALATPAFYVGVLGSRRRIDERNARLILAGVAPAEIGRIHAPIGVKTSDKTPWGIAVSIISEISPSGGPSFSDPAGGEPDLADE